MFLSPDIIKYTSVIGPMAITILYAFSLARIYSKAYYNSEELVREKTAKLQSVITSKEKVNKKLKAALDEIKILQGIMPICSICKKIRKDDGYWQQVDSYITEHSDLKFSHSYCPECARKIIKDIKE